MNPYKILGVQKGGSEKDIKRAYRELAMKNHPDKGGSADKFKQIAAAYEILSDPEKKRKYDQFGSYNDIPLNFNAFDIFKDFFGPNNIGAPPFGGFSIPVNRTHQEDLFGLNGLSGLGVFMGELGNMTRGANSFTQTSYTKDGKQITTTTHNGKTTVTETNLPNIFNIHY